MNFFNRIKTVESIKFFTSRAIYLIVLFTFFILKNNNICFKH